MFISLIQIVTQEEKNFAQHVIVILHSSTIHCWTHFILLGKAADSISTIYSVSNIILFVCCEALRSLAYSIVYCVLHAFERLTEGLLVRLCKDNHAAREFTANYWNSYSKSMFEKELDVFPCYLEYLTS